MRFESTCDDDANLYVTGSGAGSFYIGLIVSIEPPDREVLYWLGIGVGVLRNYREGGCFDSRLRSKEIKHFALDLSRVKENGSTIASIQELTQSVRRLRAGGSNLAKNWKRHSCG